MKKKVHIAREKKKSQGTNRVEITGIVMILLGFFVCLSLGGYGMGIVGNLLRNGFYVLFGVASFGAALVLIFTGAVYVLTGHAPNMTRRLVFSLIAVWILLAGYHHHMLPAGSNFSVASFMTYGGMFCGIPVGIIRFLAGNIGTTIILTGLFVIDILLLTHWSVSNGAKKVGEQTEKRIGHVKARIREKQEAYHSARNAAENAGEQYNLTDFIFHKPTIKNIKKDDTEDLPVNVFSPADEKGKPVCGEATDPTVSENAQILLPEDNIDMLEGHKVCEENTNDIKINSKADMPEAEKNNFYSFPPLSLLKEGESSGSLETNAYGKANRLETTLKSFGVNAKIVHVSIGPAVTRYELEPAPGVRVSKIEGLSDDIALQLAATSIRIEAPIPGKSAVGIEIPNAGKVVITDLAKMPHLLIAGQTGSGKSVCINTIITSILYHSLPEDVKLILIDPKVVELSIYNGIPHLRTEVVTEPKKAAGVLNWAVTEMETRYRSFAEKNVRDINGFNKQNPEMKMPFIVVVIDELADLMMVAKDSVEDAICRLAQKARAAGIHLVVATQRPSVDVITGLIKANIPSRISFAVSSQVDSRTILDKAGAEKLLGKGDMLFNPSGASNPIRIQGAFISDEEVEAVVSYVREQCIQQDVIVSDETKIDLSEWEPAVSSDSEEPKDELLAETSEWVVDTQRASVSALQRRFRIGYTRAGRLMDTMELMGIVSKADGAKPRTVLVSKGQLKELFPDQIEN